MWWKRKSQEDVEIRDCVKRFTNVAIDMELRSKEMYAIAQRTAGYEEKIEALLKQIAAQEKNVEALLKQIAAQEKDSVRTAKMVLHINENLEMQAALIGQLIKIIGINEEHLVDSPYEADSRSGGESEKP